MHPDEQPGSSSSSHHHSNLPPQFHQQPSSSSSHINIQTKNHPPPNRGDSTTSTNTSWSSSSAQSSPSSLAHHPHTPQPRHPNYVGGGINSNQNSHTSSQLGLPIPYNNTGGGGNTRSSPLSSTSTSGRSALRRRASSFFCFGLLMVHSTFVTLVIFDLLLLSHSLIFTISNYLNGERRYSEGENEAQIIEGRGGLDIAASSLPYDLLLPLFGVQVFWLVAAILALISLKTIQPYWQLPYLFTSGVELFATVWLIVQTIQALAVAATVEWALALTLSFANVVFLVQLYFLYIKIACMKALIRKRKSVVSTVTSEDKIVGSSTKKNKNNLAGNDESRRPCTSPSHRGMRKKEPKDDDTYSTQSTVVMTDSVSDNDSTKLPRKTPLKY